MRPSGPTDRLCHANGPNRPSNDDGDAVLTGLQRNFPSQLAGPRDWDYDAVDLDPIAGIGPTGDQDVCGGLLPWCRFEARHLWHAAPGPAGSYADTRPRSAVRDPHLAPGLDDLEAWEPDEGAGRPPLPVA